MYVTKEETPEAKPQILLEGENKNEFIPLHFEDFILARSMQNYVEIWLLINGQLDKDILRGTLTRIESQLPDVLRVHRSYLINPLHAKEVKGIEIQPREILRERTNGQENALKTIAHKEKGDAGKERPNRQQCDQQFSSALLCGDTNTSAASFS